MITDMLPSYKQSLQYITNRIAELETAREVALRHKQWVLVSSLGNRLIALCDTRLYLSEMVKEIERHEH